MIAFQENLKRFREKAGITAKDFAALLGIKYTTYMAYENEGREPKQEALCKIAAALHVSIDELLAYKPDTLARWQKCLDGQNLGFLQENGRYIVVDGSDGTLSRHATFTEKELVQLLEYAERLAENSIEGIRNKLICNTIREQLTAKIALSQENNS